MVKRIRKIPPVCLFTAIVWLVTGRLQLLKTHIGTEVRNEDGNLFRIFRNIKAQKQITSPNTSVFVVSFKFARLSHKANKLASIIPMLLIAGFPGFIQKMYAVNDKNGYWQGMYQWQSKSHLEAYKKSFVYKMMNKRAIHDTITTNEYENRQLIEFVKSNSA